MTLLKHITLTYSCQHLFLLLFRHFLQPLVMLPLLAMPVKYPFFSFASPAQEILYHAPTGVFKRQYVDNNKYITSLFCQSNCLLIFLPRKLYLLFINSHLANYYFIIPPEIPHGRVTKVLGTWPTIILSATGTRVDTLASPLSMGTIIRTSVSNCR